MAPNSWTGSEGDRLRSKANMVLRQQSNDILCTCTGYFNFYKQMLKRRSETVTHYQTTQCSARRWPYPEWLCSKDKLCPRAFGSTETADSDSSLAAAPASSQKQRQVELLQSAPVPLLGYLSQGLQEAEKCMVISSVKAEMTWNLPPRLLHAFIVWC